MEGLFVDQGSEGLLGESWFEIVLWLRGVKDSCVNYVGKRGV